MPDMDMDRRPRGGGGGNWVWWIVGALVIALLIWWWVGDWGGRRNRYALGTGTTEVQPAPVTLPPPVQTTATIPVGEILSNPRRYVGRTYSGNVLVTGVPTQRGFWIETPDTMQTGQSGQPGQPGQPGQTGQTGRLGDTGQAGKMGQTQMGQTGQGQTGGMSGKTSGQAGQGAGQRLFVVVTDVSAGQPLNVYPNQYYMLQNATVREPSVLNTLPGPPLDPETLDIAQRQPVLLTVAANDVQPATGMHRKGGARTPGADTSGPYGGTAGDGVNEPVEIGPPNRPGGM